MKDSTRPKKRRLNKEQRALIFSLVGKAIVEQLNTHFQALVPAPFTGMAPEFILYYRLEYHRDGDAFIHLQDQRALTPFSSDTCVNKEKLIESLAKKQAEPTDAWYNEQFEKGGYSVEYEELTCGEHTKRRYFIHWTRLEKFQKEAYTKAKARLRRILPELIDIGIAMENMRRESNKFLTTFLHQLIMKTSISDLDDTIKTTLNEWKDTINL